MYSLRGLILEAKPDHVVAALYALTLSSGTYTAVRLVRYPLLPRPGGVTALHITIYFFCPDDAYV